MDDVVDRLLAHVSAEKSALQSDIVALERSCNAPIPKALERLWQISDGAPLDALRARILGPKEILNLLADDPWEKMFKARALLPFLDDNESNYLAVSMRSPLSFRVLHLPHDDGSRLLYKSIESCFDALLAAMESGDTADIFIHETAGDYPAEGPRSLEDQNAAKSLLNKAHVLDEWNHAIQLLDASNLDEFAKVLETDHFIRRDALERMRNMQSPAIQELLQRDGSAFECFVSDVRFASQAAGIEVGERQDDALMIAGQWYNLEAFFYRRKIAQGMPRMMDWIQDRLNGENPYHRPGNFMTD